MLWFLGIHPLLNMTSLDYLACSNEDACFYVLVENEIYIYYLALRTIYLQKNLHMRKLSINFKKLVYKVYMHFKHYKCNKY